MRKWVGFCLLGLGGLGCGSTEPPPPPKPEPKVEAPSPPPEPAAKRFNIPAPPAVPQRPAVAAPTIPDKPDEVLRAIARDLSKDQPAILWYMLPASYQNDIQGLLGEVADQTDPDIWHSVGHALREYGRLFKEKKALMEKNPVWDRLPIPREQVLAAWDPMVEIVQTIGNSELADHARLKKLDIGQYLAGPGAAIVRQLPKLGAVFPSADWSKTLKGWQDAKVEGAQVTGDEATVTISRPGQGESKVPFVRVEGKWIPKGLADSWPGAMKSARDMAASWKLAERSKNKIQTLDLLNRITQIASSLANEKDPAKFDQSMQFAVMIVGMITNRPELNQPSKKEKELAALAEKKKKESAPAAKKDEVKPAKTAPPDAKAPAKPEKAAAPAKPAP